jgi:A/G-specific adenine glycosylase
MLQQTQVNTVIPYYQRWLIALPDIASLALAPPGQVLKLWEGLGYYRRALYLHRGAQVVMQEFSGEFPRSLDQVLTLPGIGRTTAGGILSAAFNLAIPILDGNVKRVLARLIALPKPPAQALRDLWALSEALLDPDYPRDFNQALMDLGATICRRRHPLCFQCPWQESCQAYNKGKPDSFPMTTPSPERPHKHIAVAVVFRGKDLLIDQRPETSMLGGLWEFPGGKIEPGETPEECVVREVREEIGIDIKVEAPLTTIEHAYTHFTITLMAYICRYVSGEAQALQCSQVRWIRPEDLQDYAFPMANQKVFPFLRQWLDSHLDSRPTP